MNTFKPYREIEVAETSDETDGSPHIQYANGDEFVMTDPSTIWRLVEFWNACRNFHSNTYPGRKAQQQNPLEAFGED